VVLAPAKAGHAGGRALITVGASFTVASVRGHGQKRDGRALGLLNAIDGAYGGTCSGPYLQGFEILNVISFDCVT